MCTEVADLEVTVGVDEHVPRLQISVQYVSRVDILQPSENLRAVALLIKRGEKAGGREWQWQKW